MRVHLEQALEASQQAEAELRAREERLQISLEAANVGTWDWNIRTGELRWSENLERIHGQAPGAFRGTFEGFLDGVHTDDRPRVLAAIQRALVAGEAYEIEYRSPVPDGTVKWFEGRGHVIRNAGGEPVWMSGICMDTTERHRLQEQLRQTQRLESLGLLAGGIAHDFNNLLTGIIGNSSLAIANLTADDPAKPLLRNVLAASQRAAQLTQQLLAYAGKGRVASESLDLGQAVEELLPLLRPSIPAGVQLLLDGCAEPRTRGCGPNPSACDEPDHQRGRIHRRHGNDPADDGSRRGRGRFATPDRSRQLRTPQSFRHGVRHGRGYARPHF